MKKVIISAVFIIICFLLQSTLFSQFGVGGIVPNLLIIVTASLSFLQGKRPGLFIGFFCGLLVDLFFGSIVGFYALIYMWIGYINGMFKKIIFPEDVKLPLLLIVGSDFFYNLICYILQFLLKGKFDFFFYLLHIIIPEVVYTTVLAFILYPLIHVIYRKLEEREKKGEQNIV